MAKVSVIGSGAWGTTLSILLAEKGHEVVLWSYEKELVAPLRELRENKKYLPGFPLPAAINITGELQETAGADIIFFAVPTQFARSVASRLKGKTGQKASIVSASKGIEEKSLKLPLEILKEELGGDRLAALSGPNLSAEIARGLPAAAVVASEKPQLAAAAQAALMLERFRVYTSDDPIGVQLGGALKNIVAIAAGIADGLELGNNAKAALMIRGIAEMTRLGIAMGAKAKTFSGLSGIGDLITTCSSELSRNHCVGVQLAQGKKLPDILAGMKDIAEGVPTAKAALALGIKHGIELPIIKEVYAVLYEGKNPCGALTALMTRSATSE